MFKAKFLQNFANKETEKGFTLIELLVVVIIIGVLAAIATPNMLAQIGKARESEAKVTLGSIIRAQNAYHMEKATFVGFTNAEIGSANPLGISETSKYFTFLGSSPGLGTHINLQANPINQGYDGVRTYAWGIVFANSKYGSAICVSGPGGVQGFGSNDVAGAASPTTYYCANGSEVK